MTFSLTAPPRVAANIGGGKSTFHGQNAPPSLYVLHLETELLEMMKVSDNTEACLHEHKYLMDEIQQHTEAGNKNGPSWIEIYDDLKLFVTIY